MDAIAAASTGLATASARFTQATIGLASAATGGGGDLAAAIVGQAQAGVQLQAAANVTKVSDEMTAVLLDITV
jgi:hypothetical protein